MIGTIFTLKDWAFIGSSMSLGVVGWSLKDWNAVLGCAFLALSIIALLYKFILMGLDHQSKRLDIRLKQIQIDQSGEINE